MESLRNIWRTWGSPQGAAWLPVLPPAGAFAELVVLFGIIHLVNFIAPDIDILSLEPSPYWLPILLLSLQYGTVAGLLAAGAATLALVMNGLPEQNIDEHHFAYLLRVWSLPMLWIGVALVLGQFRLRQIEIKQQLKNDLDLRTRETQALTGYAGDLERRCRELERVITSRGHTSGAAILEILSRLGAPGADLTSTLEDICRVAFPGAQLTVYALQSTGLEAAYAAGGAPVRPRRLNPDHALYRAVAVERTCVSVLDVAGEKTLSGEGLAAVPILHDETGRVLGLLKLERASSEVLTSQITTQLAVVASLIAPMMAEPRIVVDNTAERAGAAEPRPPRRHFSWQHGPGAVGVAGDRNETRPRVQK